ncbi:MAG: hypothetical protein IJA44_00190 [Clostridia bacterium]|nr:hypothetical protein [Clostridia bacterium]
MNLAEIFGDNMVLQRDKEICIFGCGEGKLEIELCGKVYNFISKNDKFNFYLPPHKAGGPFDMTVTLNGEKRVIKNILIGDVYIAAGQSNIEFLLEETADIEYFDNENIRFFTEPNSVDEENNPIHNSADWIICRDKGADKFSAIGYYFANSLQKHTGVPVGVISCSKGASRVDAWTSPEYTNSERYIQMQKVRHNDYNVYKFNHNSYLYKNKLLNIVPFPNSGVLWYQGESNRGNEESVHYAEMLEIMIKNWREIWNDNLPFYCVQLMPYNENAEIADWAMIRSQQELVSKTVDNTYLVTIVNTGESKLIHPVRKKTVSYELANAVRNVQFGENVEYCGPILEKYEYVDNKIKLFFSHALGLNIKGEGLRDFYVYSKDGKALPFDIQIDNNCLNILLTTNLIPNRITLGYNNAPEHNLYNAAGYLASPFDLKLK